jgi:hypothetical protein
MNQLRKHLILLAALVCASIHAFAQAGVLEIYGMIKDESTKKKLEGALVVVIKDGVQFDTYDPGASGKYEINVPLGSVYDFKFTKTGYLPKVVRFDTKNIPAEDKSGGFQTDMDITLFLAAEGFNMDLVKEPFGIASFNSQENAIAFDFDYTEKQMSKITNEFKRLENSSKDDEKKKKDFDALVAAGDQFVTATKYADGIQKYGEALALFPNDAAVKKKKDDAQKKLDELNQGKELEAKYKKLIDDGNAQIKTSSFANARKAFEEAAKLKPTESLPKDKLAEIAELEKNAESKKKYDTAIAEADKKFGAKDYTGSISKYKEAQGFMPKITYPGDQIKEAEKLITAGDAQKRYDELIASADKDFKAKAYEGAIEKYKEAQSVKPTEVYPKDQISACNKAMGDAAATAKAAAERKQYDDLIKEADKNFKAKAYSECIDQYKAAQAILSEETYPKNQITLAQKAMGDEANSAKQAEEKKRYDALIADADKKFTNKDYGVALEKYQEALGVMPGEKYPKDQILKAQTALDALLANEADKLKRQRDYDDKMKMGDDNAESKKYDAAINFYKDAQRIKPEESLPAQKIKSMQDLIAEARKEAESNSESAKAASAQAEIEKRYQAKITEADALFEKNELEQAKSSYEEALVIKSDASYPKSKLERIEQMLLEKENDALAARKKEDANAAARSKADAEAAELAKKKADLEARIKAEKEAAIRKQEEDRAAREKSKMEGSNDWTSSANEQAESELEEYYRNARKLEEQARYKAIEDKKFKNDSLIKSGNINSNEKRAEKREELIELETAKKTYAENAADRNRDQTNELVQRKDEYNSFQKKAQTDSKDLIDKNTDKAANQKTSQTNLSAKGTETLVKTAEETDKKKKDQQDSKSTYQSTSESRIAENNDKNEEKKQQQVELKGNNRYQESKSVKLAERKTELQEESAERAAKNADIQTNNEERVNQKKEQAKELMDKGTAKQQDTADRIQDKNNTAVQQLQDKRSSNEEKIQLRQDKIENTKEAKETLSEGKDEERASRAMAIEAKKAEIELAHIEQRQKSQLAQMTAAEKLKAQERGDRKSEEEYLVVEGTETLPEGVTENSFKLGEKMVTERTVKVGNKIDKYRKVVSKTGTYYFKNGKSISEGTWKQETLKTKRS